MLATKPKFRLSSLISGDYDEKFEAYMDDQFVGRDMWRKLKVTVDRICGSRLENGVYIGRNGQLLEQIEVADENHLAANIKAIKSFSESQKKIPVRMMLVPDAANVLNHSLPALAKPEDQTQMFSMVRKDLGDSVEWIDVSTELNKHKTEKIYYKTDHHWTTLGAFYAFPCIKEFGMTSDEFATRFLQEEKVAVVPGTAFGACGEGFLRISYAYSLEALKEALDRMERFVQKLRAEKKEA